ncbi:uncharacterized protein CIMG_02498 [Coccidioides immitis RS]|uniref:Uncharacterized protein n=3 Tax=Coccidioides immitis TaxID=5501 RepID=J3KLI2_COCIM|nr:uncharacterized protein CIMG_02498 [Coccidioides immitis RS]EAS37144.3 hypothetical protein CIMG_02498 [Coccidioides immitis RS]KMP10089.1 hypothetical protein CIRG_09322 [Coccidioides immitis RMSCC 2394]KMU80106.1 hypothetical protein CISG_08448 [Coccidioides immitis RMSCC 3703]TPX24844.1 hypothetical protein DIZ76_010288 [Coccidioides immitis]
MLSLPLIEPRDSHMLWFTPPHSRRTSYTAPAGNQTTNIRRNGQSRGASHVPPTSDSLAALMLEERALRIRKQNIASFGYSWIRPAGYPKTMQGIREEEAEREEAANAAMEGEMEFMGEVGLDGGIGGGEGDDLEEMERDLDDEIPEADEDEEEDEFSGGLVEDGEDGLDEDDLVEGEDEEEVLMERDLDDDIPEGFGIGHDDDDDDQEDEDFDEQPDLDDDIPSASPQEEDVSMMERDLDEDVPEQEWEHTDTDAEEDEEDDQSDGLHYSMTDRYFYQASHRPRSSISTLAENSPPLPPPLVRHRETEAQRLFLERWSGGIGDDVEDSMAAFRSSGMSERNLRLPRIRNRRRRSTLSDESINVP